MKKSDLNHKDKFLLGLSEVLMNEEHLFDILGSDAENFYLSRSAATPTLTMKLKNGALYDLVLKEK